MKEVTQCNPALLSEPKPKSEHVVAVRDCAVSSARISSSITNDARPRSQKQKCSARLCASIPSMSTTWWHFEMAGPDRFERSTYASEAYVFPAIPRACNWQRRSVSNRESRGQSPICTLCSPQCGGPSRNRTLRSRFWRPQRAQRPTQYWRKVKESNPRRFFIDGTVFKTARQPIAALPSE